MAAFVLNAADAGLPADFSDEGLWGKTPKYGVEAAGGDMRTWWCYCGDYGNLSVITNYADGAVRYDGFGAPSNVQPDYMKAGEGNTGFVDVLGLFPLLRSFLTLDRTESGALIHQAMPIPDDTDLFVDMLAMFEPREDAATVVPTADVEGLAKFMCWLSCPPGSVETNFIVTAGWYGSDGEPVRTNYVTTARVEPGRWYRLTARAVANAASKSGSREAGFALYLDGEQVVCPAGGYALGENAAKMDELFKGNEHYDRRGLFPSMQRMSEPALHGVAVQGCARFDELGVVTNYNPLIGRGGCDRLEVALVLDPAIVTNVACEIRRPGETEPYFTTNATGLAQIDFAVWTNDVITVTGLPRRGHTLLPALALVGNRGACQRVDGYEVTMAAAFDDPGRLTLRVETCAEPFRVDGRTYGRIEDALEAASVSADHRLTLLDSVVLDPETDNGQLRVLPRYKGLVLDLFGSTIKGIHFQEEATVYVQGQLTVIDSVGGGVIEAPGTVIEVDVSTNDAIVLNHAYANLQLGSEEYCDTGFSVSGRVRVARGALDIRGGTYLTPSDEAKDTFYLAPYVSSRFGSKRLDTDHWQVRWDNFWTVRFEVAHGAATPAVTNVVKGTPVVRPTVVAEGYSTSPDWSIKGTQTRWNFDDPVTGDLTLVADQSLVSYQISYDVAMPASAQTSYTVEGVRRALQTPERTHFVFVGWYDANHELFVSHVGKGAVFVGTSTPVSGDLDLRAKWRAETLTWSNTLSANVESNGTYGGSWSLTVPEAADLPAGSRFAIDEIDFCIVNPNLYPKTAECLAVKVAGGATVISAPRTYALDAGTGEYLVTAADRLANGRPKVAYRFSSLSLTVGAENEVFFCKADGTAVSGFLRLKRDVSVSGLVFGRCKVAGGNPESEEYKKFCPVFEMSGHLMGDDE